MSWMRSDYTFPRRAARVVVDAKEFRKYLSPESVLRMEPTQGDLEAMRVAISNVLESAHPELAGCTIWAFRFSISLRVLEVLVEHNSLPATPDFAELPIYPPIDRPFVVAPDPTNS